MRLFMKLVKVKTFNLLLVNVYNRIILGILAIWLKEWSWRGANVLQWVTRVLSSCYSLKLWWISTFHVVNFLRNDFIMLVKLVINCISIFINLNLWINPIPFNTHLARTEFSRIQKTSYKLKPLHIIINFINIGLILSANKFTFANFIHIQKLTNRTITHIKRNSLNVSTSIV